MLVKIILTTTIALALIVGSASDVGSTLVADSVKALTQKAGVALNNQNFRRALENYTEVLRLDPDNFEATKNCGVACAALGKNDKARMWYLRALNMDPLASSVANNLGVLYSDEGNSLQAIKYFGQAVALDSTNVLNLTNLGQEYAKTRQVGKALPLLRRANELGPDNAIVLYHLGTCFASSRSLDSAEIYFEQSAAKGGNTVDLFYHLGTVKNMLRKPGEAEAWFKKGITLAPEHTRLLQSLGLAYFATGRYLEAIEEFQRAVATDSTYYAAWVGLGASYSLSLMNPQADSILFDLMAVDSTLGFQMMKIISQEQMKANEAQRQATKQK